MWICSAWHFWPFFKPDLRPEWFHSNMFVFHYVIFRTWPFFHRNVPKLGMPVDQGQGEQGCLLLQHWMFRQRGAGRGQLCCRIRSLLRHQVSLKPPPVLNTLFILIIPSSSWWCINGLPFTHGTTMFEKSTTGGFLLSFHVKKCRRFSKLPGGIFHC